MEIQGSIALITGGNRGLGKAFVQALLDAGAGKVYIGTRQMIEVTDIRLHPVQLDITNAQDISRAQEICQDITILINNAGIGYPASLLTTPSVEGMRAEMETNYLGTLAMCRAFAPILKKNGGGVLANMLSVASWYPDPRIGGYSASKAAEWSLTNSMRMELRAQGTLVTGIHAGFIDTDMVAGTRVTKARPEDVAAQAIAGILAGEEEILADTYSHEMKTALATNPSAFYKLAQDKWDHYQSRKQQK